MSEFRCEARDTAIPPRFEAPPAAAELGHVFAGADFDPH